MSKSAAEDRLAFQLRIFNLPPPEREYRFHDERRWRFDFAWPERMLAVEVDGGTWSQGRHTRGAGYAADCEKGNAAIIAGWRVLHYTTEMITSGEAVQQIEEALSCSGQD